MRNFHLITCALVFSSWNILMFFPQKTHADAAAPNMGQKIASLRSEIDGLTASLQTLREEHRAQVSSFSSRKAELEIAIERDQSLQQQVDRKIIEAKNSNSALKDNSEKILPDFLRLTDQLKNHISSSIPYSRKDRLESIDMLANQVKGGELNVFTSMGRLWALIEDEFRVANEINISKQTIHLDGTEILSDVVKIGSIILFFRSNEGQVGYAAKQQTGEWEYLRLEGKENKRLISNLFDSLKMQVRVGLFELPMALPHPTFTSKSGG